MSLNKSCAFTGHRQIDDPPDMVMLNEIVEGLIAQGVTNFYCGMARGFDMIAAQLILDLKQSYGGIKLIACISCPEQDRFFGKEDKRVYARLVDEADEVKIVNSRYFRAVMLRRNDYMVDRCRYLIAYLRRETGGTAYTVEYARNRGRKIFSV